MKSPFGTHGSVLLQRPSFIFTPLKFDCHFLISLHAEDTGKTPGRGFHSIYLVLWMHYKKQMNLFPPSARHTFERDIVDELCGAK